MSTLKTARAIADVSAGKVLAVVEIAVPPERVFRALTEEVAAWWGSPELYQVTEWESDLRVGGRWRSSGKDVQGKSFSVSGEYLEIDPPHRLVQSWQPDWDGGARSVIRYQLEPFAEGTRVVVHHEGFGDRSAACQAHADGWERVLGWLSRHFAGKSESPAGARYFFCRLLPPRPSFAMDMSAEEAEVMKSHALYWRGLLARGTAVVFGPVADPQGAWGMGVLRAADEAEVKRLQAEDPAILSRRGFRSEAFAMLSAVH
jgi:uncharacterized protein YndB with AHSA1/START domain